MQRILALCFLALGFSACATVTAPQGPLGRIDLGYSDRRYFALKHAGAVPSGARVSGGLIGANGGWITGRVCGVEVNYDVLLHPREQWLSGFILPDPLNSSVHVPAYVFVRDRVVRGGSRREVFGVLNGSASLLGRRRPGFDFWMSPERLEGRVGNRRYHLVAEGDAYVGAVHFGSDAPPVAFVIHGRSALWSMPASDQAAILPLMLSCVEQHTRRSRPVLAVSFDTLEAGERKQEE